MGENEKPKNTPEAAPPCAPGAVSGADSSVTMSQLQRDSIELRRLVVLIGVPRATELLAEVRQRLESLASANAPPAPAPFRTP